jgi:hypothetical protein
MGYKRALIGLASAAALLSGCGAHVSRNTAARSEPTPTLAQQVRRAERTGPGSLNYCPRHTSTAPAAYSLTIPGGGTATGWCRTLAQRFPRADRVTFWMYWDARRHGAGRGTEMLRFELSRKATVGATPVPMLVGQAGLPPP